MDTEHGINTAVRKLRFLLRDSSDDPQYIQTVTGKGYRFIAPTNLIQEQPSEAVLLESALPEFAAEPKEATLPAAVAHVSSVTNSSAPRRAWFVFALLAALLVAIPLVATPIGRLPILTLSAYPLRERLLHPNRPRAITSLAVVPLDNLSGDPNQNYLADGMTDELITMLAKDSTLRITSRTSVMQYKGVHRPLSQIAQDLKVDAIVEGAVSRENKQVHMTLKLIRADTDTHLWAETYDRNANSLALLPDEAARAIAKQLNSASQSPATTHYVDPEVHDAYLRGLYFWYAGQDESAGKYFKRATTLQPDYALGWSGLSSYYGQSAGETMDPDEALPSAEASAAKALELDPMLADAHLSMGVSILFGHWDFARADHEALRAVELDPQSAQAYHVHAMILAGLNRHVEAIVAQKKATELNPYIRPWALPRALLWARQYDAALQDALPRLDATPGIDILNFMVSRIYHAKKMEKEAAQFYERGLLISNHQASAASIQRAYQLGGYKGLVTWRLHQLQMQAKTRYVSPFALAILHAELDDREQTLTLLEESARKHSPELVWVQCDPEFDFIHRDPRFHSLIQHIGLPVAY